MEAHAKVPIAYAEERMCWLFNTVGGIVAYRIEGCIYKSAVITVEYKLFKDSFMYVFRSKQRGENDTGDEYLGNFKESKLLNLIAKC